jgi:hypothetical protein
LAHHTPTRTHHCPGVLPIRTSRQEGPLFVLLGRSLLSPCSPTRRKTTTGLQFSLPSYDLQLSVMRPMTETPRITAKLRKTWLACSRPRGASIAHFLAQGPPPSPGRRTRKRAREPLRRNDRLNGVSMAFRRLGRGEGRKEDQDVRGTWGLGRESGLYSGPTIPPPLSTVVRSLARKC